MQSREFRAVRIERGPQGWGGPLVIEPTVGKDKIMAVTGGGIPELAYKIAEMTGAEAVDGFRAPPPESEVAAVVIDCGGPARCRRSPPPRGPPPHHSRSARAPALGSGGGGGGGVRGAAPRGRGRSCCHRLRRDGPLRRLPAQAGTYDQPHPRWGVRSAGAVYYRGYLRLRRAPG